jgi:hypothetical protein
LIKNQSSLNAQYFLLLSLHIVENLNSRSLAFPFDFLIFQAFNHHSKNSITYFLEILALKINFNLISTGIESNMRVAQLVKLDVFAIILKLTKLEFLKSESDQIFSHYYALRGGCS